jgi:hypothetical protein
MEDAGWPATVEPVPVRDEAWDTFQTVELRPPPELEEERQVAVALEDGMEKRRLKVRVRQAMAVSGDGAGAGAGGSLQASGAARALVSSPVIPTAANS